VGGCCWCWCDVWCMPSRSCVDSLRLRRFGLGGTTRDKMFWIGLVVCFAQEHGCILGSTEFRLDVAVLTRPVVEHTRARAYRAHRWPQLRSADRALAVAVDCVRLEAVGVHGVLAIGLDHRCPSYHWRLTNNTQALEVVLSGVDGESCKKLRTLSLRLPRGRGLGCRLLTRRGRL